MISPLGDEALQNGRMSYVVVDLLNSFHAALTGSKTQSSVTSFLGGRGTNTLKNIEGKFKRAVLLGVEGPLRGIGKVTHGVAPEEANSGSTRWEGSG